MQSKPIKFLRFIHVVLHSLGQLCHSAYCEDSVASTTFLPPFIALEYYTKGCYYIIISIG